MRNLSDKVALITGSSIGIGRGCAIELARAGAHIVVHYRSHPRQARQVVAAVRRLGRQAVAIPADMADAAAVEALARGALRHFGRVDILINNAACSAPRLPLWELPPGEFEKVWRVYTFGSFLLTRAIVGEMIRRRRRGKVLLISSIHAEAPYPLSSAHNSSKAAANQLFLTLAAELAPHRINVNIIEPGWTDTPGERKFVPGHIIAKVAPRQPWGRLATITDIGRAAVFLCSDEADYISGAVLRVDGTLFLPRLTSAAQVQ